MIIEHYNFKTSNFYPFGFSSMSPAFILFIFIFQKMKLKRMLINKGAWPDDVEDRRDADTVINAKLMEKYQKALQQLKTRCQSK